MNVLYVDFSISQWTGHIKENRYARKLEHDTHAKFKTFSVRKKALPDCTELQDLLAYNQQLRMWHYNMTLPYDNNGGRIIPSHVAYEYMTEARSRMGVGRQMTERFLNAYPTYRAAMATALGDAYNEADYPDADRLASKFDYTIELADIPEPTGIRKHLIGVPQEEVDSLIRQAEERADARIKQAVGSLYASLHEVVAKLADKLAIPVGADGSIFRDSLIENIKEVLARIDKLNITNDPELRKLAVETQAVLSGGVSADTLRNAPDVRSETAQRAAALAAKMKSFL